MEYTSFFTNDDLAKRGYDLSIPGKLEMGTFNEIQDAIDDVCQECFDGLYGMIEEHNGEAWTRAFFYDMSQQIDSSIHPRAYKLQEALKWCLVNHVIFILDNGDKNASAKVNNEKLGFSVKVVQKLYNSGILEV